MKPSYLAIAAVAILATAACNADKNGNGSAANPDESTATVAVTPPADGDWSQIVTRTDAGGFMMGNPNAKVKLIEFGSMTCPHCAHFEAAAAEPLENYTKSGKFAFEFRNFVRDPFDVTASLVIRCGDPKAFFPLTKAMYADQLNWVAKLQAMTPAQQQALSTMQPQQEFTTISNAAGFPQWAAMRGIPAAKVNACVTNQAAIDQLVQMNNDAVQQYNVPGTPTFVMNGKVVDLGGVSEEQVWPALEAKIKAAL